MFVNIKAPLHIFIILLILFSVGCSPSLDPSTLQLRQLTIIDEEGSVRAVLGSRSGVTVLEIMNSNGIEACLRVDEQGSRVLLGIMSNKVPQVDISVVEGIPCIRFADSQSNLRLGIAAMSNNVALNFYTPSMLPPTVTLAAVKDKGTLLALSDEDGRTRLVLDVEAAGQIIFCKEDGEKEKVLSGGPEGTGSAN